MSTAGEDSPSADGTTPNRLATSAPKNKQCPFCQESFTSSSLGRHLDLYIKDKNPKAADGIHDVDKIREIRGVITRRQPRRNIKTDETGSGPAVREIQTGTSQHNEPSPYSPIKSPKTQWVINKPSWHATGVMTDIPPTPTSRVDHSVRRVLTRGDIAIRKRLAEERTRLRATELALQELLDSVNAARTVSHAKTPFDFDFLSQTFPALCLKMLPQQPTLHSVQVIENPKYCPIGPPGQVHFERLRQLLKQKLDEYGNGRTKSQGGSSSTPSGVSRSSPSQQAESHDPTIYTAHLTQAWDVWKIMSEARKVSQWHLEVVRAFSSSQEEQKRLSSALDQAEAEQEHLRLQIERLNECQQPKEFTYQIPTNWHIPKKVTATIMSSQTPATLDRETLISKWTTTVRANSRFQQALPEMGLTDLSTNAGETAMDYQNTEDHEDNDNNEDGDSIDAAGEDDEDPDGLRDGFADSDNMSAQKSRIDTNFMNRTTLDPSLRENVMDIDPGDYGAGMLLGTRQSTQIR